MQIVESPDRNALAEMLAERVDALLGQEGVLAVSGGTTPVPFFQALKPRLTSKRITITLTDERIDASNEKLVRERLLTDASNFVPLRYADEAATEKALASLQLPFSAVILGMGEDGHVASLFPRHPALAAGLDPKGTRHCLKVEGAPKPPPQRLSLTYPCLMRAKALFLHIAGQEKRALLERVLEPGDVTEYPVRAFLRQTQVPLTVYWAA